ncbi:unnamed protein product [Cochlearia groenlandica]
MSSLVFEDSTLVITSLDLSKESLIDGVFELSKMNENSCSCSSELVRAIEECKFAVVVISKNYAASRLCLEELIKIMENADKGLLTVMHVFYGVDPCHLWMKFGEITI